MDNDILKNLQDAALLIYEERAMDLLKSDKEYQQLSEREKDCEKGFQQIQEILPKSDLKVMGDLLNLRDREAALYNFWVFVVGVNIGFLIKDLLDRTKPI